MTGSVPESPHRRWGFLALTLALLYAGLIHHGVGPYPDVGPTGWWSPRQLLLGSALLAPFEERPLLGVLVLTLPALILTAAVFATLRSALARLLALAAALAVALFLFYGLRDPGPRIWSFFGWRGSAVMEGLALIVSAAALAPLLAASWLRQGWPVRIALYVPVFALVVACLRNVTGTDSSLRFAISPWPVVTLFGFGVAAYLCVGVLLGAAVGLGAQALGRGRAVSAAGVGLGLGAALAWALARFPLGVGPAAVLAALTAGVIAAASLGTGGGGEALARRARYVALGTLLAGLPLLTGAWLARLDYETTRNERGQQVIDALAGYFEREAQYPDDLEQLIRSRDLAQQLPPQVGFGFLGEAPEFGYQSFGNSYLLEFSAPDWVQCAYNPPWSDDLDEDELDEPDDANGDGEDPEEGLPGSWSCPSQPPDLW